VLSIPLKGQDISSFRALTFRTGTNFAQSDTAARRPDFEVALVDEYGADDSVRVTRFGDATATPAGTKNRQLVLNGVRIPLSAFQGVDLRRVKALELRFGSATKNGSIQLADVMVQEQR